MNRALTRFLKANAFSGPPYPTSRDLIQYLNAETADSLKYAIVDLFQTITLWDNRTESATATELPDGTFEVTLRVGARKFRADSVGGQHEIPIADLVEIGAFGEGTSGSRLGRALSVEKVWVRRADTTVTMRVTERPARAGIDPYNKLIDRDRRDNVRDVTVTGRLKRLQGVDLSDSLRRGAPGSPTKEQSWASR
jgi:hypothetical protein